MANPVVITITDAILRLGATEATAVNYECQVTEASINASPNLQDVPATFCAPSSQAPAATSYELAVTWLQDWTADDGGLSNWAFLNDAKEMYFELSMLPAVGGPPAVAPPPLASGQVRIVAGSFGGAAGTPLTANATWPIIGKPTIEVPTGAMAAAAATETEAEMADTSAA
jgi:hypothetical protein